MNDLKADLSLAMLAHVQKTGQALELLQRLGEDEIFNTLSKHNPFWHESDKLEDLRMKLCDIEQKIHEVRDYLTIDPYEGNV